MVSVWLVSCSGAVVNWRAIELTIIEAPLSIAACLWFSEIRLPLDKATYLTKVSGYQVLDQNVVKQQANNNRRKIQD